MNAIVYNIENYYNESFFVEIEEICRKPFHLYWEVVLFFKTVKAKRQVRKIEKLNLRFAKSIYKMDFATLTSFEEKVTEISQSLSKQVIYCNHCANAKCRTKYIGFYFTPLKSSFDNLLKSIKESYHINADNVFDSDSAYLENNEALRSFSDIWDCESTKEEKEFVFKQNAELMPD
jgi:hypothetical protein